MLPLLLLLLDRQVPQLCKEEPPAPAGGFFCFLPQCCAIGWFDSWQARLTRVGREKMSDESVPAEDFH